MLLFSYIQLHVYHYSDTIKGNATNGEHISSQNSPYVTESFQENGVTVMITEC